MVGFGGSTLCATESYSLCIKYPEEAFQRQINLNGPENKRKFTWRKTIFMASDLLETNPLSLSDFKFLCKFSIFLAESTFVGRN